MLAIDSIVEVHHGSYEAADCLTVIVGLMNRVPDGVDDVAGGGDIALADLNLEVAYLAVEGRWHLWQWEVVKEPQTIDFNFTTETDGTDDGARS